MDVANFNHQFLRNVLLITLGSHFSVKSVEVVELCENLRLAGLPNLSRKKHLVHHSIHLHQRDLICYYKYLLTLTL